MNSDSRLLYFLLDFFFRFVGRSIRSAATIQGPVQLLWTSFRSVSWQWRSTQ